MFQSCSVGIVVTYQGLVVYLIAATCTVYFT